MGTWWLLILLYSCVGCEPDLAGAFRQERACHEEFRREWQAEADSRSINGYLCIRVGGR